ncbi:MAG TPA: late competence development ComFB family protein [Termitinemataceae bacterium]|nr:late competence development ComFB family protein [Termitinemataceae bacterium]HOM22436.1 late competence development ComFB family protein [Termitinemataceae bacterium]HPP99564.1 late competence development ComFB family protein [Termitinemataceae bacterium]
MGFKDQYDFEQLVNEAERLVIDELERQLDALSEPVCRCEDCVLDMATLALNAVKPLYRVSLLGSLYAAHAMDEASYAESLRKAVAAAIQKVRENPSHD